MNVKKSLFCIKKNDGDGSFLLTVIAERCYNPLIIFYFFKNKVLEVIRFWLEIE